MRWIIWLGGLLLLSLSGCRCGGGSQQPCTPSTCEQLGKNCGSVDDGCGFTISCGYCGGGLTCGGDGVENVCGGTLSCARSSCAASGSACGDIPDGCGDTLSCGFCSAGLLCDSDTRACGVPACTPRSCGQAGADCGVLPDACGGSLDCGPASICASGTCGGGGPNRCGTTPCTPLAACPADACGIVSDGCGDVLSCGNCAGGRLCTAAGLCADAAGTIGTPCNNDAQCTSGTCLSSDQNGWPGGYCTAPCTSDASCGAGANCGFVQGGVGLCVETCSASCRRTGYLCSDADGDGQRECVPGGTGTGGVGEACSSVADCAGGASATCIPAPKGGPGGSCTVSCGRGSVACPSGSHCGFTSGTPVCVVDCPGTTPCRSGFVCGDWDGDGKTECTPGGQVGDPCTTDTECPGGACQGSGSGYPGGYCTTACAGAGECPPGSSCGASGQCERSCTSSLDCRSGGYACVASGGTSTCLPYGSGSGGPGDACQTVADCAGGAGAICVPGGSGQPGRCTTGCASDADCAPGSRCVASAGGSATCEITCTTPSDCGPGYTCSNVGGGSICLPDNVGGGPGAVGDACTDDADCKDRVCFLQQDNGWRGGYCSAPCTSTAIACPDGSHCAVVASSQGYAGGVCFKDCSGDADCGRPGITCWDHDDDGSRECAGYAGGSGNTGDPCTAIDECNGGPLGECFLPPVFPAGYCTQDCSGSGCAGVAHCATLQTDHFCLDAQCCAQLRRCDLDEIEGNLYPDCPGTTTCKTVNTAPGLGTNVGYCVQTGAACGATVACPDDTYCSADSAGECIICDSTDRCRADYDCFDRDRTGDRECWPAAKGSGQPGSPCTRLRDCSGGIHGSCAVEQPDGSFQGGYCLRDCKDGTPCPGGSTCTNFDYDTPLGIRRFSWCLGNCSSDAQCRTGYTCQSINPNRSKVCFQPSG